MIVHALYFLILTGTAALFSWLLTAACVKLLRASDLLDHPNERSNHTVPTPRGGGIAVVAVLAMFLLVSSAPGTLVFALLLLAVVSFIDDRRHLPILWRLVAQFAAVIIGVTLLQGSVTQGLLPIWLERALVMTLWLWVINLTNFMDGIDEITSVQMMSVGFGVVLLTLSYAGLPRGLFIDGGILAASVVGFWWWNRHPAKIFLGDVGSVPLGFMMGFLLLQLAASGQWAAALLLPAYYLIDASLTLGGRLLRGQRFWEAHSEHAYQHAVRAGRPHDAVVREILGLNILLIVLAVASAHYPSLGWLFVGAGYGLAFLLYGYLLASRPARQGR